MHMNFPPSSVDNCLWYSSEDGPDFNWFVYDLLIPKRVKTLKLWNIHAENLYIL